ncbi:60S acidic ribosomal protein P1, putative [Trichomonas vaginalis G3]|uniref:60S acidic ribosomal protein P1, putative n=1 Tax=Trichomonas vaginalis (strain ATCC PRA-98 / G3) TaxID=412133 RepID=A2EXW1_TRIV3|nr:translational elongation [Trichomonas vaginalis G3]EAY02494.1 60S acidic ribosomal protein P1, putative [Trichomonas vaginalis G3]KAI5529070.1 translational elongation [Trichomonas vaginalis G3]|eukprot:XP_001314733.1 60S acidic ribosomal protein P1 [Trichomonas vaginalis G3]
MSAELACVYAALILNDDGIEITAEKLNTLIKAANVQLENYWVDLFADYFKNHDVTELVKNGAAGGAAPAAAAAGGAAAAEEAPKEEEKKEEEPAAPLDLGDMFDF